MLTFPESYLHVFIWCAATIVVADISKPFPVVLVFFNALLVDSQLKCDPASSLNYVYSVTLNTVCVFVDCKMQSQSAHTHSNTLVVIYVIFLYH